MNMHCLFVLFFSSSSISTSLQVYSIWFHHYSQSTSSPPPTHSSSHHHACYSALFLMEICRWLKGRHEKCIRAYACRSLLTHLTETKEGRERRGYLYWPLVYRIRNHCISFLCRYSIKVRWYIYDIVEVERMKLIKPYTNTTHSYIYIYIYIYMYIYRQCHGRNYRCCIWSCSIKHNERRHREKERKNKYNETSEQSERVRLSLVNLGLFSRCLYI